MVILRYRAPCVLGHSHHTADGRGLAAGGGAGGAQGQWELKGLRGAKGLDGSGAL